MYALLTFGLCLGLYMDLNVGNNIFFYIPSARSLLNLKYYTLYVSGWEPEEGAYLPSTGSNVVLDGSVFLM